MDSPKDKRDKAQEEAFWLRQVAAGGQAGERALQALVERYDVRFERQLMRAGLTEADAEEALQDMWIEVERKAAEYTDPAYPPAVWLNGFLRFAVMRGQRKHLKPRREQVHELDEDTWEPQAWQFVLPPDGPDARRRRNDLERCVEQAFQALRQKNKLGAELVYRREMQDWTLDELALSTGLKTNTLRTYLSKARTDFKEFVSPCLELAPS